ncbi:hypothetical protein [Tsukamurella sp. USMM236]|uniref:hypothetical protein n=1 Tax=Tsukamurella sp. USMM236 TaxID=3081301 RepID=UPI0030183160
MSTVETVAVDPDLPTMTRAEAVEYLTRAGVPCVTQNLIKTATQRGELACYRVGTRNMYSVNDLRACLRGTRIAYGTAGERGGAA